MWNVLNKTHIDPLDLFLLSRKSAESGPAKMFFEDGFQQRESFSKKNEQLETK